MKPAVRCIGKRALGIALTVLALLSGNLRGDTLVADEHIVLSTDYGDLVLELYPDVAPAHVAQIVKLVKLGAYDTTYLFRITDYFVQLSDVRSSIRPLSEQQAAAVAPIKAEFSNTLKHHKGTLSMARWDDPNSASSSFSILLKDAPYLDGRYTIFGQLVSGGSVVNKILAIPRENETPTKKIVVRKAYVITDLAQYYSRQPFDPVEQIAAPTLKQKMTGINLNNPAVLYSIAILAMMNALVGLLGFFAYNKISKARLLSLLLINVLISGFIVIMILTPIGQVNSWIAAALFIATFGMFRLMSNFESKQD